MPGIIVPAAITGSVAILVWYFMLEPNLSPFRGVLNAMGITQANQIWNTGNSPSSSLRSRSSPVPALVLIHVRFPAGDLR